MAGVEAGGERERVAEPARERDRLLRQREPPVGVARVVELEGEPGEQPRAQRRVLGAERAERLLQPRRDVLLDAPELRPAAGVAERGAAEQRRVAEPCAPSRPPRANVARASGAPARSCDAPSASSSSPRSRSSGAPASSRARSAARSGRPPPPTRAAGPRAGRRRARSRRRARAGRPAAASAKWCASCPRCGSSWSPRRAISASPDAAVQARAAQRREPVVERRAHQRVAERVAPDALGVLAQHARGDRLLERGDELVAAQRPDLLEHVEVELAADHRRRREHLPRRLAQPRQPPPRHLAHALGHARLVQRDARRRGGRRASARWCTTSSMKNGLPSVSPCSSSTNAGVDGRPPSAATSAPVSSASRPASVDPLEHAVAAQAGEQRGERLAPLVRARRREEQHALGRRRAHEVPEQLERRAVGPVQVVEHDEQRRVARDLDEQRRDRVEQAQPLRRRTPCRAACRPRRPTGAPNSGSSDPELRRARAEPRRPAARATRRRPSRAASARTAGRAPAPPRRSGRRARRRRRRARAPPSSAASRVLPIPASPASTTSPRPPAGRARPTRRCRTAASAARPTNSWRLRAASSGAGQRRATGAPASARGAGVPPCSSRSCSAIAAAPGAVPSSSRSSRRRSSNARSASAGLPAASCASISSTVRRLAERRRRHGGARGRERLAQLAAAQRRLGQHLERAHPQPVSAPRCSSSHGPSQSGRKSPAHGRERGARRRAGVRPRALPAAPPRPRRAASPAASTSSADRARERQPQLRAAGQRARRRARAAASRAAR